MEQWLTTALRIALLLGLVYWFLERRPWRRPVWRATLDLARRLRFTHLEARAVRALRTHAVITGDVGTALDLAREAIRLDLDPLNPDLPADILSLARVLGRFGQLDAAATWLVTVDGYTTDGHQLKPTILLTRTYNLVAVNRYEEAAATLERLLTLKVPRDQWQQRRKLRTAEVQWDIAMAQGYVAHAANRFDEALAHYRSAEQWARGLAREKRLATLNNLAATATKLGHLTASEQYVEEANRLAGDESWPGRVSLLRTVAELRLAQGRIADARAAMNEALPLSAGDPLTIRLAAEVAIAAGSDSDALTYLLQVGPWLRDQRSRNEVADLLDRVAAMRQTANVARPVEELRQQAEALRSGGLPLPPLTAATEDGLLKQIETILSGRKFGPLDAAGSQLFAIWLALFICLVASILIPWTPPLSILLAQSCLLVIYAVGWHPFLRWLQRPIFSSPSLT